MAFLECIPIVKQFMTIRLNYNIGGSMTTHHNPLMYVAPCFLSSPVHYFYDPYRIPEGGGY